MTTGNRMSRGWLLVSLLYGVINAGGFVYAAMRGEGMHALVHVALLAAGAVFLAWRVRLRPQTLRENASARQLDDLQRSVDALAVSVERVGEAQRYTAKLAQEQSQGARKAEK